LLYSLFNRHMPNAAALVLTAVCYACLLLLLYLVADSPDGEFRYISL
jgi:hypothetical protein